VRDEQNHLRTGVTTGTCAAAAAGAAARALVGESCEAVDVRLPDGETVTLDVEWVEVLHRNRARAAVIKHAGDDPDVTDGVTVTAEVERLADGANVGACVATTPPEVEFRAGPGVGQVTRRGLQLSPGEPAINPVPRRMIIAAVRSVLPVDRLRVTIAIPGGEELANRTFNRRLGIEGGLSVLGTSGRVIPKSEDAWCRSLLPQVDLAVAAGSQTVYLASGHFGERAARETFRAPQTAIVQCANFVGDFLDHCVEVGVRHIVLIGHAGKLVKVAAGVWNTHSRYADARLETLAALAAAAGGPPPLIVKLLHQPTVEAAVALLEAAGMQSVWDDVAERIVERVRERTARLSVTGTVMCDCAVLAYDGRTLGRSAGLRKVGQGKAAGVRPASSPECSRYSKWRAPGKAKPPLHLTVVGVGPGAEEWITPAAWQALRRAEVIVGGRRQLARFGPPAAEQIVIDGDIEKLTSSLRAQRDRHIVVLASGDPGFFGILATLRHRLPEAVFHVLPGISSVQLAAARLGRPWDGMELVSAHGLDFDGVIRAVGKHASVMALTDSAHSPQALAKVLTEAGYDTALTVLEHLGEPDERITTGSQADIASGEFEGLSVVVIDRKDSA